MHVLTPEALCLIPVQALASPVDTMQHCFSGPSYIEGNGLTYSSFCPLCLVKYLCLKFIKFRNLRLVVIGLKLICNFLDKEQKIFH